MFAFNIVSDIHYAGPAEQARGDAFHYAGVVRPSSRLLLRLYRRYFWLRDPLHQNHLLDQFLESPYRTDLVVTNGDYSCDSAFVGVSDDASCESVRICLSKLRGRFGSNLLTGMGDHEIGKRNLIGGQGGLRLSSWHRATGELGVSALWTYEVGRYLLIGVASPLLALPVYENDINSVDKPEWEEMRREYIASIDALFDSISTAQKILLFCHDPSALPMLFKETRVRHKLNQIEHTIIGHLHSNLILFKSRLLAGIPPIRFLGHTTLRTTTALNQARHWKAFNVRLCPSLSGIELLKDGGFYTVELDTDGRVAARFMFHPIRR